MSLPFIFFIIFLLLIVSYLDVKYKKISNYWIILNLVLAILLYLLMSDTYSFSWKIFIYPLGFLLIGLVLFAMNLMGAGDAKFLFSFYLLLPLNIHETYFTCLLITTVVISGWNLFYRAYQNRAIIYSDYINKNFIGIKGILLGKKMTYAPVIMLAWLGFILGYYYDFW